MDYRKQDLYVSTEEHNYYYIIVNNKNIHDFYFCLMDDYPFYHLYIEYCATNNSPTLESTINTCNFSYIKLYKEINLYKRKEKYFKLNASQFFNYSYIIMKYKQIYGSGGYIYIISSYEEIFPYYMQEVIIDSNSEKNLIAGTSYNYFYMNISSPYFDLYFYLADDLYNLDSPIYYCFSSSFPQKNYSVYYCDFKNLYSLYTRDTGHGKENLFKISTYIKNCILNLEICYRKI